MPPATAGPAINRKTSQLRSRTDAGKPSGDDMATYVSLVSWTEQGIKNFPDTIKRAREFTRRVERAGGMVREVLWSFGEYNLVHISQFATDEAAAAAFLVLESAGNVRVRTMRVFDVAEMEDIINLTGVQMEHDSES